MTTFFPHAILSLRIEKGLSQKDAAAELGISPALLSHSEKGIRECGIDFLCRCADFYDVTTDFLLGRSAERRKSDVTVQAPSSSEGLSESEEYKQQLIGTVSMLFDTLSDSRTAEFTKGVNTYLSAALYKALRYYKRPELFLRDKSSISDKQFPDILTCLMAMAEMKMKLESAKLPRSVSESPPSDTPDEVRSLMRDVELYCHAIQ